MIKAQHQEQIVIIGAGLVGCLLALSLKKVGYNVTVYEKRKDPRKAEMQQGKSINLALSDRGILALKAINLDQIILSKAIPMSGRMVHQLNGEAKLQPYHHEGKTIFSISRATLNLELIAEVEKNNIDLFFDCDCDSIDFKNHTINFLSQQNRTAVKYDFLFGADGAYSQVRQQLQRKQGFNYSQEYLDYGYKEFYISPENNQKLSLNALHIWPRHDFMMIALPNPDHSFTCTLFLRLKGANSFESLDNSNSLVPFFEKYFPDIASTISNLESSYKEAPTGYMVTIKASPWNLVSNVCLIGDAAHAIVPFYGQGMNAGFESVRLLSEEIGKSDDLQTAINSFCRDRKHDTDAIADLAQFNFVEMRDKVDDSHFLLRKQIEKWLKSIIPDQYQTVYEQVTFSKEPYSVALEQCRLQEAMYAHLAALDCIKLDVASDESRAQITKALKDFNITLA